MRSALDVATEALRAFGEMARSLGSDSITAHAPLIARAVLDALATDPDVRERAARAVCRLSFGYGGPADEDTYAAVDVVLATLRDMDGAA